MGAPGIVFSPARGQLEGSGRRLIRTHVAMEPTPHLLSELPFFRDFSRDSLRLLSASAMHVRLEPGVEIFREGDVADRFYVLRSGRITVGTRRPDGQVVELQVLGPGEMVGWSWLLPPHVWQFSARTVEPVDAICFSGTRLRHACESEPTLGYQMVRAMAESLVKRLGAARARLLQQADATNAAPATSTKTPAGPA